MAKHSVFKNHAHEIALFHRRVQFIIFVLIVLVACLIYRLCYLQIREHKLYTTLSRQNLMTLIPIAPDRGLIYDRNGQLIARNVPSYSIDITPARAKPIANTIARLSTLFPISKIDIKDFNKERKLRHVFDPVPLKYDLTPKQVATFYVNQFRFNGVSIHARLMRTYPEGKFFAPVLGYVGRINAQDLRHISPINYSATNYIGKVGVEKYYEALLHGKVGYQQVESDAAGRIVRTMSRTNPTSGVDLYLTIDAKLQRKAFEAMKGRQGAVVAIDPNNGQILALVSTPTYNPNLFVKGLTQKKYKQLAHSPEKPLYNRAIRAQYPPGSTVKPFIALGALAAHLISPRYTIDDPGWFRVKGSDHVYHDWKPGGHGFVNLYKAIVVSCDTYFFGLADHIHIQRLDEFLQRFGFGQDTGIDLPGEQPGLVPSPKWKMHKRLHPWFIGDTVNAGIGQGYVLATPLQLAVATAIVAMRGTHYKPTLLLKMKLANGVIVKNPPQLLPKIKLPIWAWRHVLHAMRGVIYDKHGTGFRFGNNHPFIAAGKTGTSQVISKSRRYGTEEVRLPKALRDHSLFIVFAPYHHPQIAVAVIVEHAPSTSVVVARKVVDEYLVHEKHLGEKSV